MQLYFDDGKCYSLQNTINEYWNNSEHYLAEF